MSKQEDNEPIRIAQIMGKWVGGGVEAVVMNYYRHIDRTKIQFDFLFDEDSRDIPYKEIESLGGKVILIPPYQRVFKYQRKLKKVLKEGNYKIVHSHINTLSVFPLRAAKKAGVPIRIAHSHATSSKKEWKRNIIKNILRPMSKMYATNYVSCSEHAGRYLFGNKTYEKKLVRVIKNAIDLEIFKYDNRWRQEIRNEFSIDDATFVIGHIGRFVETKNHLFTLRLFSEIHNNQPNTKLMLVGEGPLKKRIIEECKQLGIEDSVIFTNQRDDVNKILCSIDLLVLPSLFEGLGMVLIEAQASNLPAIASTNVPKEAKINENLLFLELNHKNKWINLIKEILKRYKVKDRKSKQYSLQQNGYDIEKTSRKLAKYYFEVKKDFDEKNKCNNSSI